MKNRRVLVLTHEDLVAPDSLEGLSEERAHAVECQYDVVTGLRECGHDVRQLGVSDDLIPIRRAVEDWKPHIVFNLLEEFQQEAIYDHNVVSYLQLLKVAYTGCGPRGLVLTRDKSLAKKILAYHRIRVPHFFVVRRGRKLRLDRKLEFPLIVKSLVEESSTAIAKASVVRSKEKLAERVQFIHDKVETDAIVEQFIAGRELYVAVIGNERLQVLPPQELLIPNRAEGEPLIATERVKHDREYQEKRKIKVVDSKLTAKQLKTLESASRRAYRALELRGYARLDFRMSNEGEFYFLEANPNPELAEGEEFASAAEAAGIEYPELLQKILNLGLRG